MDERPSRPSSTNPRVGLSFAVCPRRAAQVGCGGGSRNLLNDLDELFSAIALGAGKLDQFLCAYDDRVSLGAAGDRNASAAAEVEQSFVTQEAHRAENGVRVDPEHSRKVTCRRQPLAGFRLSLGDCAPELRSDLMVQVERLIAINLDVNDDAIDTSVIA